jgi:hypothetical protein
MKIPDIASLIRATLALSSLNGSLHLPPSGLERAEMGQDDLDDYDLVRFVFDLRKEDAFGTVMRAQMHIEHELRRFILSRAVSPKHAKCDELDFEGTTRLAITLGLNTEIKPALAVLGTLQKRFARNPNMKFGEQEANNFYNALGPELRSIIREIYDEFRVKENLVEFKRQAPSNRLIYFLLGIWSAISADRKQAPEACFGTLPTRYVADLETRQSAFFQLLDGDDDLGMVIRGHIHLEHELKEFILAAQSGETVLSEYDYAGTLGLALALGLNPLLEAGLMAAGTLRNKFAHRLEMKLTEDEAKKIYATLDPGTRADAEQAWSKTLLLRPDTGRAEELLRSSPKDLIATTIAMLWTGVVHGHVRLRAEAAKRSY